MTKEQKQNFTMRISRANPTEMVVILYDMLLCYVQDGLDALEQQEEMEFGEAIRKAKGCLSELMNSIHPQYEPAAALFRLSGYCVKRLTMAQIKKSAEPLVEIQKIIRPIRDAYHQISAQNNAGPVMNNTQTVYVGLTYGRNTLTENMTDQGFNRGMYA